MELYRMSKRMIFIIIAASLVIIGGGAVYSLITNNNSFTTFFLPFALGVALMAGLNSLKIIMLKRSVNKAIESNKPTAGVYIQLQSFLRFVITGLILFIAVTISLNTLWGAAAGILTMPIAAYSLKFFKGDEDENKNV